MIEQITISLFMCVALLFFYKLKVRHLAILSAVFGIWLNFLSFLNLMSIMSSPAPLSLSSESVYELFYYEFLTLVEIVLFKYAAEGSFNWQSRKKNRNNNKDGDRELNDAVLGGITE